MSGAEGKIYHNPMKKSASAGDEAKGPKPVALQQHPDMETKFSEADQRKLMRRGSVVDRYRRASFMEDLVVSQAEAAQDPEAQRALHRLRQMQKQGSRFGGSAQSKVFAFEVAAMGEGGVEEMEIAVNPFCVLALPEDIRRGFVRKVFGIVAAQLALTFGIISLIRFAPGAGAWVLDRPVLAVLALLLTIPLLSVLYAVRKRHPWNLVVFSLMTMCFGYGFGALCVILATDFFVMTTLAVASSAALCAAVSYFVHPSHMSIKHMGPLALACVTGVSVAGKLVLGDRFSWAATVSSSFIAALFACWLVWDVGAIQVDLSADEYITGAADLYLDIISMMIWLIVCCFYCSAQAGGQGAM